MRTDNYLSICLEQAAKSPLHYRHGCIVVRGGKIIGQGFNDYRPGFNGGALKHGRIAKNGLDGPGIAEMKAKLKENKKGKQQSQPPPPPPPPPQQSGNSFTPFEGTGGGYHANMPLSMHSEMMAIHSALSASSTLSSASFSSEKPCFKLPGIDKRKARLRAEVIKFYVNVVCAMAAATTTSGTAKLQAQPYKAHPNHSKRENAFHNLHQLRDQEAVEAERDRDDEERTRVLRKHAQQSGVQHLVKECQRAFQMPQSGGKHHQHQKRKANDQKKKEKEEYQYGLQYRRHGSQTQRPLQEQHEQRSPAKCCGNVSADCDTRRDASTLHEIMTEMTKEACAEASSNYNNHHSKHKKEYERSGKMKAPIRHEPPQPGPMLLPKGQSVPRLADRKKHPRLAGADLYVARLGWCRGAAGGTSKPSAIRLPAAPAPRAATAADSDGLDAVAASAASLSSSSSPSTIGSGSLHDELLNRNPSPCREATSQETLDREVIRASRPCYRCITYMHNVGIKRVFWTNDGGEWEGGKVRDLVDALESSMEMVAGGYGVDDDLRRNGGVMGNGVFVTKHEVLMLKRMMGVGEGK